MGEWQEPVSRDHYIIASARPGVHKATEMRTRLRIKLINPYNSLKCVEICITYLGGQDWLIDVTKILLSYQIFEILRLILILDLILIWSGSNLKIWINLNISNFLKGKFTSVLIAFEFYPPESMVKNVSKLQDFVSSNCNFTPCRLWNHHISVIS